MLCERRGHLVKEIELTDAEYDALLVASQPVRYMVIGGIVPRSPRDRALRIWREIAERNDVLVDSITPTHNPRVFRADKAS